MLDRLIWLLQYYSYTHIQYGILLIDQISCIHLPFIKHCKLWNNAFNSGMEPWISSFVVPCIEIFAVRNISPFSEYSSPWSLSRRSQIRSSDFKKNPLREYKIILLSVIMTLYFLVAYWTIALLWNLTFSKGSKKSCNGIEYCLNVHISYLSKRVAAICQNW